MINFDVHRANETEIAILGQSTLVFQVSLLLYDKSNVSPNFLREVLNKVKKLDGNFTKETETAMLQLSTLVFQVHLLLYDSSIALL